MRYVPRHLPNKLEYKVLSCISVHPIHLISFRFGHFGPGPTETDITVLSFRLANRGRALVQCVCVFRLLSTKLQPPGGTIVTAPSGRGCALGGSVGNPFDRVWPPTTSGDLQPIFSCVDSRGTHPLCVYVREYGTHTHVVCTWVCVG